MSEQAASGRVRSIVGCEMTTGEREVLYLVPICKRCGHAICPGCGDWCDGCFDWDFDNDDICNAEGPDFHPECAETNKCVFDGEVEEVGPLYGMDLPEWLEKQRSLEGEVRWFKKLLRDALKGGLSVKRHKALEEVAKKAKDES